jgi:hypothetical protein
MPRRGDAPDRELADVDDIAARMRCVRIGERGVAAGMDRDRSELRQGSRARNVVVVDVRLERVGDEDAQARGRAEVGVDVSVGIDKKGDAGVGIRDEIARVPEAGV